MFTFINPVEHYIREIRVPCRLEPNDRTPTNLPFVFDSRSSSRVQSPYSPRAISEPPPIYPSAKQILPPVKRQLHREILYYFGCNEEFSKNRDAVKYYKDLHSLGIAVNLENEASRQLYKSSTNCPRHRILLRRREIDRTVK
ncbi:uncharacterized protein LOC125648103 [Ostrea edulis]|uniref:uncharacterized protein LOC125648103 n=1 Tax=Ostrea edulis TaxID=37623 RepID=UPI0024AEEFED|nr:uncharacterized protein LOC125648103 [Ostrea edulis]XP_048730982.2 uncharacterized protein LOC125648103 [Ostrea edulis]XP_048730983.2 uncharacterized protein LOC125648103 [Ostrea edulis]